MFLRFSIYLVLLVPVLSLAQKKPYKPRVGSTIVDDSTKSVYGPQTTKWTTEQDIFYNRNKYQPVDTSIINYHRWTNVQKSNNYYKDLGNVGTAMSSIFPLVPKNIGVSSGFTAFDPFYDNEEPKYFDTKSPYSRVYLIWGGNSRSMARVEFSRNVNPRWNIGFNYHPMNIDKQIQRARKGDKQTTSNYYDAYTTYRSKDDKYSLLFSFRRLRHRVKENGGIDQSGTTPLAQGIFDGNAKPYLTVSENTDLRTNYHLFHQYKIGSALQIYHTMDRYKQLRQFTNLAADASYFTVNNPNEFGLSDTLRDKSKFRTFQNEFGVKGKASKLFYNFYYKLRHYDYSLLRLPESSTVGWTYKGTESYLGARASVEIDSLFHLSGWGEIMADGNHRLEGKLNTPWLDAEIKQLQSKPAFMQMYYQGGHNEWNQKLSNTQTLNVNGFLKGKFGPLFISPGLNYMLLSNYIFFRENPDTTAQKILPVQSTGFQHVVSPEVRMEVSLAKKFFFRPTVIYTQFIENADDALSIPKVFINTQLTYEGFLFKKNLQAQIGFDLHWQSDYYALGYDAPTQQFYRQDKEVMLAYPLADFFINGKIKRGKFFIKYHNIVQAFRSIGVDEKTDRSRVARIGYVPTPGYPGQRNILDFGFELLLFN